MATKSSHLVSLLLSLILMLLFVTSQVGLTEAIRTDQRQSAPLQRYRSPSPPSPPSNPNYVPRSKSRRGSGP